MTVYNAPATRGCDRCSKVSALVDVSLHGVAAYRCPNDHISLVDVTYTAVRSGPRRVAPEQRVIE